MRNLPKNWTTLNGDSGLTILEKIMYFPICIIHALEGTDKDLDMKFVKLNADKKIVSIGSPSRRLSNMFWETIDWEYLSDLFDSNCSILDIGCGNGQYGNFFKRLIGDKFNSYRGIDIYKNQNFPEEYEHILDKAENASKYISNENCIFSQSALEHIEDDKECLSKITQKLTAKGIPFIQIHMVPATSTLFLYLWHGWRQYSRKNLGLISKILSDNYNVNTTVIPLGSWRSFFSHFLHITTAYVISAVKNKKVIYKWDIPESKTSILIKKSVLKERKVKDTIPSFWALIISSKDININKIFK